MSRPNEPLAPVRRARQQPAATTPASDYDDAEVARGQAAAVLGAMGRMQLKLEVMSREQQDAVARLTELLESVDRRLAALEQGYRRVEE
jgi:hypothetical protein